MIISIIFCCILHVSVGTTVICYYESWASATFAPSDIEPNVCTYINYAFLNIKNDGSLTGVDNNVVKQLQQLKQKNPKLKLIFSVGGWNAGSTTFSAVAADSSKRNQFASNSLDLLIKYKFDGIDVDWEYPAQRGGQGADKQNFISLLQTLSKKLKDSNKNYIVSVAVSATPEEISYDVPKIAQTVDYINLMTYDYNADGKTYENSPLYPYSQDSPWQKENANADGSVKNWRKKGAPANKLTLGLAFYGKSYQLQNANNHGIDAPTNGAGQAITYSQICTLKGYTEVWNDEQKVPYMFKDSNWIGYDNPKSIGIKLQYAKSNNLGGVIVWAVDQDDKNGGCGQKLGLQEAIKNNL